MKQNIFFTISSISMFFLLPCSAFAQTYNNGSAPMGYTANTSGYLNGSVDPVSAVRNENNKKDNISTNGESESLISNANGDGSDKKIKTWDYVEPEDNTNDSNTDNTSEIKSSSGPQTIEERNNEIAKFRKELRNGGNISSNNDSSQKEMNSNKKSNKLEIQSNVFYNLSGYAKVLDGITLSLNGKIFTLKNLQSPGNGEICYGKNGLPWECGNEATRNLKKIVDGQKLNCSVMGNKGVCITDTNGDVIKNVIQSGYAFPTKKDGNIHYGDVMIAKEFKNGLYQ